MTLWGRVTVTGRDGKPVTGAEEQDALRRVRNQKGVFDIPDRLMYVTSCMNILSETYGYARSLEGGMPVDGAGEPIPLYTYPAIEYLAQLDFSDAAVFEYGSGQSTAFWSRRARRVYAVEDDPTWRARLTERGLPNVEVLDIEATGYVAAIDAPEEAGYDVIVVDGHGHRYDCAAAARAKLRPGGMVILDNSDWHPNSAALLRGAGLIQVDMTGFKPGYYHTSTTSLFLDRGFSRTSRSGRQPEVGLGALDHHSPWDKPGSGTG